MEAEFGQPFHDEMEHEKCLVTDKPRQQENPILFMFADASVMVVYRYSLRISAATFFIFCSQNGIFSESEMTYSAVLSGTIITLFCVGTFTSYT